MSLLCIWHSIITYQQFSEHTFSRRVLATGQHHPAVCLRVTCNFVAELMDREEAHYVAN